MPNIVGARLPGLLYRTSVALCSLSTLALLVSIDADFSSKTVFVSSVVLFNHTG